MTHCWSQVGAESNSLMVHQRRRVGAVYNGDGASLEPYAMSMVHHWSRARDDGDDTLLEPSWSHRGC